MQTTTLPLLLLAACGGLVPAEGTWQTQDRTVTSNTCGGNAAEQGDGVFELHDSDADAFAITFATGAESTLTLDCRKGRRAFECAGSAALFDDTVTTVTLDWLVSGELLSDVEMAGDQQLDLSCTGSDCATIENATDTAFPCEAEAEFTALAEVP